MSDFQPKRFGKYMLLDTIATGGMAQLYLAKITGIQGFEKLIAIKKILPHIAEEKELVSSFIDEAKLAALLSHQNVVQIYDFGEMEDSYFISMEYLFGKNLKSIWNKAKEKDLPISLENALYIVSRICSGLAYAHELKDFQGKPLNIIHRDISPQNILITYQGDVKILDFGIAKAASQSTVTQFGMIKGKVAYMSPEQAAGKQVDQRSDLFSVGIILYELVTQNRMFTGESTIQILTRVREGEFESPESVTVGLSPKICEVIGKAVAKEPEDRYQSCSDMFVDLEQCMIELSLRPTGRGLARYMQELFNQEIAEEDRAIRELSGLGRTPVPENASRQVTVGKVEEATESEPKSVEKEKDEGTAPGSAAVMPTDPETITEAKKAPEPEEATATEKTGTQSGKTIIPATDRSSEHTVRPSVEVVQKKKPILAYVGIGIVVIAVVIAYALWPRGQAVEPRRAVPETTPTTAAPAPPATTAAPTSPTTVPDDEQQKKAKETAERAKSLRDQARSTVGQDPQKAKSLLLEAITIDPSAVEGYFRLGLAYVKLKEYRAAIETYSKVATMDPDFPDIYFNLGFAYAMNKDYAKAEEMYDKVVSLAPHYLDEALFNLAMVQEKQSKKSEAILNLERALAANPKNQVIKEHLEKLKKSTEKKK
jgi:serine/threonine protein kinase/Tfp pilus assembly protein PilF